MKLSSLLAKARQSFGRLRMCVVQPCPPELYACEACHKLECDDEEWLHCEKRLGSAESMHRLEGSKCKFDED